jgi:hypothetical protein
MNKPKEDTKSVIAWAVVSEDMPNARGIIKEDEEEMQKFVIYKKREGAVGMASELSDYEARVKVIKVKITIL